MWWLWLCRLIVLWPQYLSNGNVIHDHVMSSKNAVLHFLICASKAAFLLLTCSHAGYVTAVECGSHLEYYHDTHKVEKHCYTTSQYPDSLSHINHCYQLNAGKQPAFEQMGEYVIDCNNSRLRIMYLTIWLCRVQLEADVYGWSKATVHL